MKFLNNISVKHKLIITYFIVVIIPILIIGYFLTSKLYTVSFSYSTGTSKATLKQLNDNYTNKFASCKSILDGILNYKPLMDYIGTNYTTDYQAIDDFNTKISPFIRSVHNNEGDIKIRIYSDNETIRHSVEINNTFKDLENQKWFNKVEALWSNTAKWTVAENIEGKPQKKYLGCYKVLKSLNNPGDFKSVIAVFFDEAQLFSLISEEKASGKVIFLYDNNNQIITTTERELLFGNVKNLKFNSGESISGLKSNSIVKYKGNDYLFFKSEITEEKLLIKGWTLACLIPASEVLEGIKSIWISSLILCLVCIVIALILIMLVSGNITGRVRALINKIKTSIDNDFVVDSGVSGTDEIGSLEHNFIEMMNKIHELINEVYISGLKIKDSEINYQRIQTEKRKAEIISLQTQINPHYLFNTLETIRMSLVLNDDKKNANIVAAFAESFRQCIDNKKDIYTLREELQFLKNYFTIQEYRLRGNICFKVLVPDRILDCKIPKLILQPVIENAVYHGIEMKGEKGTVEIMAEVVEENIRMVVTDDGVGISEPVLQGLVSDMENKSDSGEQPGWTKIALRNVNTRLKLLYGDEYGLKISSRLNEGTRVEILFPLIAGEEAQNV